MRTESRAGSSVFQGLGGGGLINFSLAIGWLEFIIIIIINIFKVFAASE
jgi:hypothetical protein